MSEELETLANLKEEKAVWTVNDEVAFFQAAVESKPVGIKKHFEMCGILQNLKKITNKDFSSESVWTYLNSLVFLDALDDREENFFPSDEEDFCIPPEIMTNEEFEGRESEAAVEEKPIPKVIKDYTRVKDRKSFVKKKEKVEIKVEKSDSPHESDEEDTPLVPAKSTRQSKVMGRKSSPGTSIKQNPRRTMRATKDSIDKEASPASTSSKKSIDECQSTSKREKVKMGKRSLRLRGDEDSKSSSPAPTPPPTKRSRRI